jgi:four helix bundle protein
VRRRSREAPLVVSEGTVRSYRDLLVWSEGIDLAEACYRLSKDFPRDAASGMTSQVRRSAVAIPANIAEGYRRENHGEFVRFLRIAQGSLKELETHLLLASRVGLASDDETARILERCVTVGKMRRSLIRSIQARTKNGKSKRVGNRVQ